MSHGQDEGQVSARVDRHPLTANAMELFKLRVDDHQFGAVLVRLLHGMQLARLDRVGVAATMNIVILEFATSEVKSPVPMTWVNPAFFDMLQAAPCV